MSKSKSRRRHRSSSCGGFLTCLNDILVPHLKSIFGLTSTQVMLVQFAFFSAYFLFSVPWSKIVNRSATREPWSGLPNTILSR